MKYLAAYLLAQLSKESPDQKDITAILSSVGIEVDAARVKLTIEQLKGKNTADLIAQGSVKLASVSSSAAASAPAAASSGKAASAAAPVAAKEEEKEESDEDMGFGLFD